jgi:hypothetical protein
VVDDRSDKALGAVLREYLRGWPAFASGAALVFVGLAVADFESAGKSHIGWMNLLLAIGTVVGGIAVVFVLRQGRASLRRPRVRTALFYGSSMASALLVAVIGLTTTWRAELVAGIVIFAAFGAGHVAGSDAHANEDGKGDGGQVASIDALDDPSEGRGEADHNG